MAGTGGIRGGGRAGGSGGPKGAGGSGKAAAAKGASGFGKVDKSEALEGVSRQVSALAEAGPTDPVMRTVMQIAGELRAGQIKTKDEATRKFVAAVLKENLKMQSARLTATIADTLQSDARLSQTLERIWAKGADASR